MHASKELYESKSYRFKSVYAINDKTERHLLERILPTSTEQSLHIWMTGSSPLRTFRSS